MIDRRQRHLILGLLAFLAVGWAQIFGLNRGFMCDCGGVERLTPADHCHGPHSAACHEDEDHSAPHPHDEDDEHTHKHAAVVDSLPAAQKTEGAMNVSVPLMPAGFMDEFADVSPSAIRADTTADEPPRRSRAADEWPRRLAQVIALRI